MVQAVLRVGQQGDVLLATGRETKIVEFEFEGSHCDH